MSIEKDIKTIAEAKQETNEALEAYKKVLDNGAVDISAAMKMQETMKLLKQSQNLLEVSLLRLEKLKKR